MSEIRKIPWNGYKVASTFAGCGGSSTGYRMAGFKVVWASEFVDAARECYEQNCNPSTIVDSRDIRDVSVESFLKATGLGVGELDILDGSPPCASFSTAGNRSRDWSKVKAYSDTSQRTDDLFFEYARLVEGIKPKVFVAENVSGLVKGVAKGYFKEILATLEAAGYRVSARLLDAQWLGVPQSRQRLIFVGVRSDIDAEPCHPVPLPYRYSIRDALPWIVSGRFGRAGWQNADRVSPTVSASMTWNPETSSQGLEFVEAETDISRYAIGAEWDKISPGESSDKYFQLVKPALNKPSPTITQRGGDNTAASVVHPTEKRKFSIAELKRICGFPDDFVLTGSYAQQWERCGRAVPPMMMSHIAATIRDKILDPVNQ